MNLPIYFWFNPANNRPLRSVLVVVMLLIALALAFIPSRGTAADAVSVAAGSTSAASTAPAVAAARPAPVASPLPSVVSAPTTVSAPIIGPVPRAATRAPVARPVPTPPRVVTAAKAQTATNPPATVRSAGASGYGCGAALAYLRENAAPGFTFACPGYAYGNQAMTCVNHAPQCGGEKLIAIAVPCPAAYMNEAHNSWVLTGTGSGIDPYGYCH